MCVNTHMHTYFCALLTVGHSVEAPTRGLSVCFLLGVRIWVTDQGLPVRQVRQPGLLGAGAGPMGGVCYK